MLIGRASLATQFRNHNSNVRRGDTVKSQCSFIALFAVLLLSNGCSYESDLCSTGNRLHVVRDDLRAALLEDLRNNEIPVDISKVTEICYPTKHEAYVSGRIAALDLQQRPADQMEIPDPRLAVEIMERLGELGIAFEVLQQTDVTLLAFDNKEIAQRATEVASEVTKRHYAARDMGN
jgi:hypothetical protein